MGLHKLLYDFNNEYSAYNVVWRVSGLPDYQRILPAFVERAMAEGQPICYIHFGEQSLLGVKGDSEQAIKVCKMTLSYHFESFTTGVYQLIEEQPEHTLFLFDSLSELQTAWATDLMMENFFRVITPLIRQKKQKAFFPLIRRMHSQAACEEILKDTEIFLDLYSDFQNLYMQALKIQDMEKERDNFLPRLVYAATGEFRPISDAHIMSRFFQAVNLDRQNGRHRVAFHGFGTGFTDDNERDQRSASDQENQYDNMDAWEQFFDHAQRKYEKGMSVEEDCRRMSEIMMSRDPKIREMLEKHFSPVDYFYVREHMVGSGLIGGKACGMLIARKIVENRRPDIFEHLEAHDSFFIGSDVFYSYIVDNQFWNLRVAQKTEEGYFGVADEFAERLRTGVFSEKLEKEFLRVLEYYGECPIIVRSSSILEDGFGNAFAGKYDSVFCMGTGTIEERLAEFENAIRVVYASTMSRSALDYRLRRGLADKDEQMSLLVMRVSGSFYGDYYMPCAAGVGYSYSTYRFLESLDPAAGMLRLVMGLGTSAVDRTEGSYPRLVSMDKPLAIPYKSQAEHHKFSQRKVEVINTKTSQMERLDPEILAPLLPYNKKAQLFEHDMEAERRFWDRGMRRDITFVSCPGLVRNTGLMEDMYGLMQCIQNEYQQPVDIEFTINLDGRKDYLVNLLQCRPLQVFRDNNRQAIPENLKPEELLLDCNHCSMGQSQQVELDMIIHVDPIAYYKMPYNDKLQVAKSIGRINWNLRKSGKKILLFAPGRLGTSSPELGVATAFADISEFTGVFEVAESKAGYNPELSYGSHMFQDLVENEILYGAIFENEKRAVYAPEKLAVLPNKLAEYDPMGANLLDVMQVYEVTGTGCIMYHDMLNERLVCTLPVAGGEAGHMDGNTVESSGMEAGHMDADSMESSDKGAGHTEASHMESSDKGAGHMDGNTMESSDKGAGHMDGNTMESSDKEAGHMDAHTMESFRTAAEHKEA